MGAKTVNRPDVPFNTNVLRLARDWRQRTIEDTAKRVGTSPEHVRAWEAGDAVPTVRQARILADFYDRPFLEFFLPDRLYCRHPA
jgi:transcriptional regulator with XRE-family HTH domain